MADLIEALVGTGMSLKNLTLIGHSLGAHVAGCTAKRLESIEKIGTIIGLDPAAIGFKFDEVENRLAETDADYVQVIHTDITKFGIAKPIGHGNLHFVQLITISSIKNILLSADIYPNSGKLQPGCKKRNVVTTWFGNVKISL